MKSHEIQPFDHLSVCCEAGMTDNISNDSPQSGLAWRGNAPLCDRFDDVYYSAENGLEETRFVFLQGVGAPEVWETSDHFVIGETGFGTGLNFLATWKAWRDSGAKGRLTFISAEGFPLSEAALQDAHATFPKLAPYAEALRQAWPPAAKGFHPRTFDNGKVRLLLLIGDAATSFERLQARVDAWFLDGFAPAKNPDMWSDALLDQVARLSVPGTRFATFTAAGFVRRALQDRGFTVQKTPGYGRKRERLVGTVDAPARAPAHIQPPEWASLAAAPNGRIAVIGSGIGGASVTAALTSRGRDVTLIDTPDIPGASAVPAAILAPRFVLDDTPASEIFTSAYALSCAFPAYGTAWADTSGVTILPKGAEDRKRQRALASHLGWGTDWLELTEDALMLPRGGTIDPQKALETLRQQATSHLRGAVTALDERENGWRLRFESGETHDFDIVIIAAGVFSSTLLGDMDCPELRPNHGQVESITTPYPADLPPHSLAYGGYVTADLGGERTIGSTFTKTEARVAEPTAADRARILADFETATGVDASTLASRSWAGVRATTPDHLPYAGPVQNGPAAAEQYAPLAIDASITGLGPAPNREGLFLLSGLGSKGFQYGPLMAEYLAAQICGDPLPIPLDAVASLHPLRDLVRRINRRQR
jgi:tRNA 5-methylaminomethyl-2-thiouridine biosynthesis bifunctional protein